MKYVVAERNCSVNARQTYVSKPLLPVSANLYLDHDDREYIEPAGGLRNGSSS